MLFQLTILSGKGGTGKTTVSASFFSLAESAVAADCDVDAPNLHLLLSPSIVDKEEYSGISIAKIDSSRCSECMVCETTCSFGAIKGLKVDQLSCMGCAVCELACPDNAITLIPEITGEVFSSETEKGPLVFALLKPGGETSGKLVTRVKEIALSIGDERKAEMLIVDGAPGIGCPVIASIAGSNLALAACEPTLSGILGLRRVHDLAVHFGVWMAACINKSDINPELSNAIRKYCDENSVPLLGEIPFDEEVNSATMRGEILVEGHSGPAAQAIERLWKNTLTLIDSTSIEARGLSKDERLPDADF